MGKNVRSIKTGALLELEDDSKALVLPRIANPATKIGAKSYRGMLVYDSSRNLLIFYNGTKWLHPITDSLSSSPNIYKNDGTLIAERKVNLGGFGLSFRAGTDTLYLKDGKLGLSVSDPISALHIKGATRADSVVLTSTALNKSFDQHKDSVMFIDSIGRAVKVGKEDISIRNLVRSNVFEWTITTDPGSSLVPNIMIGGEHTTAGSIGIFSNIAAIASSSLIEAKDSVLATFDMYTLGSTGVAFMIFQFNKQQVQIKTDTIFLFNDDMQSGVIVGRWNNGLSAGWKLDTNTRYIKIAYRIDANPTSRGNGFRNVRVYSYGIPYHQVFVNGGNHFDSISRLGTARDVSFALKTRDTVRMYITGAGNTGIGNSTPKYKLDITGDFHADFRVFTPKLKGISDSRLKKDISPIQGALSKVAQLRGVTYSWRKEMEKKSGYTFVDGKDYGVIAQEIQKVLPELVEKDKRGFFTVDYPHIVAILVEAIREEHEKINKLTTKLQTIEVLTTQVQEIDILNTKAQEVEQLKKDIAQLKAILQIQK